MFGTLTLVLHDETFIKVKPTIIYGLFAAILGGGLLFGRSFIAITVRSDVQPDAEGLAHPDHALGAVLFAMAILNEFIWRTQSTDFWVDFKVFGVMPLTMIFAITQMPLIKRYHLEPATLEASEAEAGDVSKGEFWRSAPSPRACGERVGVRGSHPRMLSPLMDLYPLTRIRAARFDLSRKRGEVRRAPQLFCLAMILSLILS